MPNTLEDYLKHSTKEERAKRLRSQYLKYDREHGFNTNQTVTEEWILKNILGENCRCHYCGSTAWNYLGADRDNSKLGHTKNNCTCCCEECNVGKGERLKEEFEKESKIYTSKNLKTMQTYTITRIEDLASIKNSYNRLPSESKIKSIMACMLSDMQNGTNVIDPLIRVEAISRESIGGWHRVVAAMRLALETGKVYPLQVVTEDLGGNPKRIRERIGQMERNRTKWNLEDFIEHYRGTPGYIKFHEHMEKDGFNDYKVYEWLFSLTPSKVESTELNFTDEQYVAAHKSVEWIRRAYAAIGEEAFVGNDTKKLAEYRNLSRAVMAIFEAIVKGGIVCKKTTALNPFINDIYEYSLKLNDGFMAFAKVFGRLKNYAEDRMSKEFGKNKVINATAWTMTFHRYRSLAGTASEKRTNRKDRVA